MGVSGGTARRSTWLAVAVTLVAVGAVAVGAVAVGTVASGVDASGAALALAAPARAAAQTRPASPAPLPPASRERAAAFLLSRQDASGGFAEPGDQPTPGVTAWAAIALVAAGRVPAGAGDYLQAHEAELASATDLELALLAERALGLPGAALVERLHGLVAPSGEIGPALNSTFWGVIALNAAGDPAPPGALAAIRRGQARSGGWPWYLGGRPDVGDTAAAILALRAAGATAGDRAVTRALAFLVACRGRDGGFATVPGGAADVQSTAWAAQALLAAGRDPGAATWAYLARLQLHDGSFRFSAAYATTPVWVTSYALVAVARAWYPVAAR